MKNIEYLGKANKAELMALAEELGIDCTEKMTKKQIANEIAKPADYDEGFTKAALERIERERDRAERERAETIAREEKEKERQFELDKIRISSEAASRASTPVPNDLPQRKAVPDMKKLMPKFDIQETDVSLFLTMFERQLRTEQIEEDVWLTQLLALLPIEVGKIILQENEGETDYKVAKKLLLDRFRLSPEAFRQKFVQHVRRGSARWKDFVYELQAFLDGWLKGLKIDSLEKLKELMITDQIKKKSSNEARVHFIDVWADLVSPWDLAEKLDRYEAVRPSARKIVENPKENWRSTKPIESSRRVRDQTSSGGKNERTGIGSGPKIEQGSSTEQSSNQGRPMNRDFERRKQFRCFICNSEKHFKANCPNKEKGNRRDLEAVNNFVLEREENPLFTPYISEAKVNGEWSKVLRDTGATIDLVTQKYAPQEYWTGETVQVRQPLDLESKCLPVAQVTLEGDFGSVITKAAVISDQLDQHRYLLGNYTAELIAEQKLLGESHQVNAITRSQVRKQIRESESPPSEITPAGTRDEAAIIHGEGETEGIEEMGSPEQEENGTKETSQPGFEESLVKITADEFREKQQGCATLVSLWEKARTENGKGTKEFVIADNKLYRVQTDRSGEERKLLVVPLDLRERVKEMCHDNAASHLGVRKSKDRLSRHFFWPGCHKEMESFVRSCEPCQKVGKPGERRKAPLKLVPIIREVFSKINIDAVGPLPESTAGNKYMITAICMASKYPEAIPVRDITSPTVIDALMVVFSRMGFPREVQCDQGTSFTSALTTAFFEKFKIKVSHSSIAHPESNPVERFHRTLKRILRVLCIEAHKEWERHLPAALLALRTVEHASIGFSPSELVLGKNLRTPDVLLYEHWSQSGEVETPVTEHVFRILNRLKRSQDLAAERMAETQENRKRWYDKNTVKREFHVGDQVLVVATTKPDKLSVQWKGPGKIEARISETNYIVSLGDGKRKTQIYHINMLKPYHQRPEGINHLHWIEEGGCQEDAEPTWEFPGIGGGIEEYDVEALVAGSGLETKVGEEDLRHLKKILRDHARAFSDTPGVTDLVTHDITLITDKPVRARPYRASLRQNEILRGEIEKMLRLGIIEVGESEYASPMILVEAPGKEPRPCIDYRRLNEITKTEFYPLPNIEERVEQVAAAPFITVLDLSKGYWQIPLSEKAQRIAAFVTSFGAYRPKRLPFGLKNAPYCFSKIMTKVLQGCEEFAVPYLDDIAVFSNTWKKHLQDLSEVLRRLTKAGLKIKPSKCKFGQDRVQYLGHVVGNGIRTPADAKVQCIRDFPRPTTKTELRAFLGLTGYYSRYVEGYAGIATPLTDMLKGKNKREAITWNEQGEIAFEQLKKKLVSAPVLRAPNFQEEFLIQTDASNVALGAILAQVIAGEEHPVLYLSRKFSKSERNYSVIERECLAIVYAVRKLHFYIDGVKFKIITDHQPLKWLNENYGANQRLTRWFLILQSYNFEIQHRAGKKHANADSLSRIELGPD